MRFAAVLFLALAQTAGTARAADWIVDHERSRLWFEVAVEVPGGERERVVVDLPSWRAEIAYDPARPEAARIAVEIDMSALRASNAVLADEMRGGDWLSTADHPAARYRAAGFAPRGGGRFRADGALTVRGVTAPLALDFSLTVEDGAAEARGGAGVAWRTFGIGLDAPPALASAMALVCFEIRARRAP